MAADQPKRTLTQLIKERPTLLEVMVAQTVPPPDRVAAIVSVSGLEDELEGAILSRLVEISRDEYDNFFGPMRPMGTLSAKIHLGYMLGLYDREVRKDLESLRQIRNVFAHARRAVDFSTPEIAEECARLRVCKQAHPKHNPKPPDTPRAQFEKTVSLIWVGLLKVSFFYPNHPKVAPFGNDIPGFFDKSEK